jgi:hypothetical protein
VTHELEQGDEQRFGGADAAAPYFRLARGGPASHQRFAREVDQRVVRTLVRFQQYLNIRAQPLYSALRVPADYGYRVAPLPEQVTQGYPDKTRPTSNQYRPSVIVRHCLLSPSCHPLKC